MISGWRSFTKRKKCQSSGVSESLHFLQVLHHRVAPVYAPHTPHVPHPTAGFPTEHGWWSETLWKRQLDVNIYTYSHGLSLFTSMDLHMSSPPLLLAKDGDYTSPDQGVGREQPTLRPRLPRANKSLWQECQRPIMVPHGTSRSVELMHVHCI